MTEQRFVDLDLPEFAFLDGWGREGEKLRGRNVILHVRSASLIEMLDVDDVLALRSDVLKQEFDYINHWGVVEHHVAALHYSATLDARLDRQTLVEQVISPACDWYTAYLEWEDKNITEEGL